MTINDSSMLNRASLSDQVYDYIKNLIETKQWKVNEKIPSETELSKQLNVNRLTVRIAIQRLAELGVLEKKTGGGTFVTQFNFSEHLKKINTFYMKPEMLDQVSEFRKIVELESTKLAIHRGSPKEFTELKQILDEYLEKIMLVKTKGITDYSDVIKSDLEFHRKICSMSHNELLLNSFDMAIEPIKQYLEIIVSKKINQWLKDSIKEDFKILNDWHETIYNSMLNKEFEKCHQAYLAMIDFEEDMPTE